MAEWKLAQSSTTPSYLCFSDTERFSGVTPLNLIAILMILNSQNKDHLLVLIRQQQELTEAVHKLFDSTAPPRQNHNQNDEINPDMNVNLQQPVQPLNLSLPEEELPQGVNRNHEQLNVNQELTAMPLTLSPEVETKH
ncbi:hypothetical protein MIMGU_mgv1a016014mg [Erythranthe guttata]|uniref:Uncharacterized protein n=1 Tax=Erythranthe guttata TaxID=4155 RepID=A0A022S3N4_ERYGU|nr:hypothetical protein MIMGU_mgv1a016014mg [Erythranthe guttata]